MKSNTVACLCVAFGCFVVGCGAPKSKETGAEEKQAAKSDDAKRNTAKVPKTDASKEAKSDTDKLEGMWTIVSSKSDGIEDSGLLGAKVSFAGDKMTLQGSESRTVSIKLDPSKRPREINVIFGSPDAPDGLPGIYEINGDTLKIATAIHGEITSPPEKKGGEPTKKTIRTERPKSFDNPTGANIWVMKRGGAIPKTEEIKKLVVGKWHVTSANSWSPLFGDVEFTADGKIMRIGPTPEQIGTYSIG
jgi:uncharacterized protein (TIGR03067 family)